MKVRGILLLATVVLLTGISTAAEGQAAGGQVQGHSITRADAGGAKTELGYGIAVNKNSTLRRQALTVHDARVGAQIVGDAIIKTTYANRDYSYGTSLVITPTEALSAIEIRFIIFDVFGERVKVLSMSEVADMAAGTETRLEGSWRTYENEVSEHFASLAFVARVRTTAGQVISADLAPVLTEANKFAKKLTVADLEPKGDPKP